jgi:hypothetical protein
VTRLAGATLLVALLAAVWAAAGGDDVPSLPADPPAERSTAVSPAAQRVALRRALTLVGPRDLLGHRLVLASPRPGLRAQIDARRRTITVFLDPADAPHRVAHDIAHELGHAWDRARLGDPARRAYLGARGAPGAAWWPDGPGDDYASGAGDFAEVFALCHAASPEFRSRLAAPPADACAALPPAARAAA